MLLLLQFDSQGGNDLVLVKDVLTSTKVMLDLDGDLIGQVELRLRKGKVSKSSYSMAFLIDNVRTTLVRAVEAAVAEGERIDRLNENERLDLLAVLTASGLTGNALQAKAESFKLLWEKLAKTLESLDSGKAFRGFDFIRELLRLMQSLWSSLKVAVPGAEQIEELLALLDQLLFHAREHARSGAY
jgi:hypothetical protein